MCHRPPRPLAAIDIDGVVADVRHRLHLVEQRSKNWDAFFAAAVADDLLVEGAATVERLARDHDIVYLTGRPEKCRAATLAWLAGHGLPVGELIMRAAGDFRPARETKVRVLRELSRRAPIGVIVDDDEAVITAARTAGFTAFLADWMAKSPDEGGTLHAAQELDGKT